MSRKDALAVHCWCSQASMAHRLVSMRVDHCCFWPKVHDKIFCAPAMTAHKWVTVSEGSESSFTFHHQQPEQHGAVQRGLCKHFASTAASNLLLQIWDMQRWICLRAMNGRHADTTWPSCLALSADGSLLASGSTGPFGQATVKVRRHEGSCCAQSHHKIR